MMLHIIAGRCLSTNPTGSSNTARSPGLLYVDQPPQERRAFGDFERRVGDDIPASEVCLLKQASHDGGFGIKPSVDIRHLLIRIERDDCRSVDSFGDQRPRELPRTAAGVHDAALVVEQPHGQRRHLPGRPVGGQKPRRINALTALPFAHRLVGPVVTAVQERQLTVPLQVVEELRQRVGPMKTATPVIVRKRRALRGFLKDFHCDSQVSLFLICFPDCDFFECGMLVPPFGTGANKTGVVFVPIEIG